MPIVVYYVQSALCSKSEPLAIQALLGYHYNKLGVNRSFAFYCNQGIQSDPCHTVAQRNRNPLIIIAETDRLLKQAQLIHGVNYLYQNFEQTCLERSTYIIICPCAVMCRIIMDYWFRMDLRSQCHSVFMDIFLVFTPVYIIYIILWLKVLWICCFVYDGLPYIVGVYEYICTNVVLMDSYFKSFVWIFSLFMMDLYTHAVWL